MLVAYWMSKNPITVDVSDAMQTAMAHMKRNHIRILPVMQNNKLAGVVTDRDIKRASASDATSLEIHELLYLLSKIKIADIMSKPAITVNSDHTIEETAEILMKEKISGAPVLDGSGALVGVITQSDIFRALVSLTGLQNRGLHLAVQLEDRPGSIMDIANTIRAAGGRIVSILTSYDRCPEGFRKVYFRIHRLNRQNLDELLAEIKRKALLLYVVDHRENRREIFTP